MSEALGWVQQPGGVMVPRAVVPTLEEMSLPVAERLARLWERNAGGVQSQFENFQDFSRRYGGFKNPESWTTGERRKV